MRQLPAGGLEAAVHPVIQYRCRNLFKSATQKSPFSGDPSGRGGS